MLCLQHGRPNRKCRRVSKAIATARSNIALAKYWGKADVQNNLPAVPSISLTLDRFSTTTEVHFSGHLADDKFSLNGEPQRGKPLQRVQELLDRVRALSGERRFATVSSKNNFATASGLASSASGFAALAASALEASGNKWSLSQASDLARRSSASAARSIYPAFSELPVARRGSQTLSAKPLFDVDHWDVALVAALTTNNAKPVGSTEGMQRSKRTAPNYADWLEQAPRLFRRICKGVCERDLEKVGTAMEQSTFFFHAVAMCAKPPILYWNAATVEALHAVFEMRNKGIGAYATMDAGPHVKVLCLASDAARVQRRLRRVPGVLSTTTLQPGPGVELSHA